MRNHDSLTRITAIVAEAAVGSLICLAKTWTVQDASGGAHRPRRHFQITFNLEIVETVRICGEAGVDCHPLAQRL